MLDHISIQCDDAAASAAVHDAVLATLGGARCAEFGPVIGLHEPKVWPEYHPNYYGGFVRDPDGNNVEAGCRTPE